MYELMKPERSVHSRLEAGEQQLALSTNERLLDVALNGVDSVREEMAAYAPPAPVAEAETAVVEEEEAFSINILDTAPSAPVAEDFDITFAGEKPATRAELETSYADKLDGIAVKVNRVFGDIIDDLFSDDDLLPRLRRLFWLEATKAERDFNQNLVKPMLRQHDRNLHSEELREAMEMDLESVSDLEELMRVWEGLHKLETAVVI